MTLEQGDVCVCGKDKSRPTNQKILLIADITATTKDQVVLTFGGLEEGRVLQQTFWL